MLQIPLRRAELQICRPSAYLPRIPLFQIQGKQAFISVLKTGYTLEVQYSPLKLFLFGQFLLKQLYHGLECKPSIRSIQQPQACSCIGRDLSVSRNALHYFLGERCLECSPLLCRGWMLHQEHYNWKTFSGISWGRVLQGQVTFEFRVRKQLHPLICFEHVFKSDPEHLCSQPDALAIRLHKHQRAGLTHWQQPSFRCTQSQRTSRNANKESRKKILISSSSAEWPNTERCATWHHPSAHLWATPPTLKQRKQCSNCSFKYHFVLNTWHSNFTVLRQTSRYFNRANLN